MKSAHFILQGKGGVGKSFVATILAQYMMDHTEEHIHCFDTDPVNQTFSRFEALGAEMVPILNNDDVIDSRKFDTLMETIVDQDGIAIIDNGAATFVPLLSYLVDNRIPEWLQSNGVDILLHIVVTGGQAKIDTFLGLQTILEKLPCKVLVWSNRFFGDIEDSTESLADFKIFKQYSNKILGIINIPRRTADTFGRDIAEMMTAYLTFDEAQQAFNLLPRQRLLMVQRDLYEQLNQFLGNSGVKDE